MGKKDKDDKKVEQKHTGSVVPEDEQLTTELNRLWARSEPPERIEVWQVFGKEKRDKGEMIFHEDFSPEKNKAFKEDPEKVNHLANEIIAAAQNDCDCTPKRREAYFQIHIIDRNRRAQPLVRRLGPLFPKRIAAIARSGDGDEPDMDEEELSARSLELNRMKVGFDEARWGNVRNDRILGELLLLFRDTVQEQRSEIRELRAENRLAYQTMQEAEDRRAQREIALEKEKFKIGLMRDGVRTARNLLPGLFSEAKADQAANGHSNGTNGHHANGHSNGTNGAGPKYGPSPERALLDNFINDCEENNLSIKLFGDFEEDNGTLIQTKPGILTEKQGLIIMGVRNGYLPITTLDPIMPDSGHELEITMDQIKAAMDAGLTDGIGMALIELKEMRKKAQETNATK